MFFGHINVSSILTTSKETKKGGVLSNIDKSFKMKLIDEGDDVR